MKKKVRFLQYNYCTKKSRMYKRELCFIEGVEASSIKDKTVVKNHSKLNHVNKKLIVYNIVEKECNILMRWGGSIREHITAPDPD